MAKISKLEKLWYGFISLLCSVPVFLLSCSKISDHYERIYNQQYPHDGQNGLGAVMSALAPSFWIAVGFAFIFWLAICFFQLRRLKKLDPKISVE